MTTKFKSAPVIPVMSKRRYDDVERITNCTIHEMVFALQHLDQALDSGNPVDDVEDSLNCLTTAGCNIDTIQQMIVAAKLAAEKRQEAP